MPRYLLEASYTADGVKGLLKEGGTGRREAVEKLLGSVGGSLEAFYYAFGETDVFVIAELPDNATAASIALQVSSAGAVSVKTRVLITPEEIDAAAKKSKSVDYRAPGK